MSGIAVSFGTSNEEHVDRMMAQILHRGPEVSGSLAFGHVVMAQNYLPPEVPGGGAPTAIPMAGVDGMRICADAQVSNMPQLRKERGLDAGTSPEELILSAYAASGADGVVKALGDAIFGLVISDGETLFAARDLLGIKTLFYGRHDGALYLSTELKSLAQVTDDLNEFPAGHYMNERGELTQYARLEDVATAPLDGMTDDVDLLCTDLRRIIGRCIDDNVDFATPTAGLLSGGMDSSVICYLAAQKHKEIYGQGARLRTYAIGVGESGDIVNARLMAAHIDSDHVEMLVDLDEILAALPEVVVKLEHFDPSLVRSSVSNYLISKRAAEDGYQTLLSGEGGDEIFCGYLYLKDTPPDQLRDKQLECLGLLHNNASLRLDRMNQCNSVSVVAPLISGELLDYSMNRIHPKYKQKAEGDEKIEKWIFRKAYEGRLPDQITWRLKQEFSQGSASADVLPAHFEKEFSDRELAAIQKRWPIVRSKEEAAYFKIFTEHFGEGKAIDTVGQWLLL